MKKRNDLIAYYISKALEKSGGVPAPNSFLPPTDGEECARFFLSKEEKIRRQGNLDRLNVEEKTRTEIYEICADTAIEVAEKKKTLDLKLFDEGAKLYFDKELKNMKADNLLEIYFNFKKKVENLCISEDLEEEEKTRLIQEIFKIYFEENKDKPNSNNGKENTK